MSKHLSSKDIPDDNIRSYLQKNYSGKQIYINKAGGSEKRGIREAVAVLRKAGWTDESIAQRLHMFPSQLKKVAGSTLSLGSKIRHTPPKDV